MPDALIVLSRIEEIQKLLPSWPRGRQAGASAHSVAGTAFRKQNRAASMMISKTNNLIRWRPVLLP
jgi:hypothetical protein